VNRDDSGSWGPWYFIRSERVFGTSVRWHSRSLSRANGGRSPRPDGHTADGRKREVFAEAPGAASLSITSPTRREFSAAISFRPGCIRFESTSPDSSNYSSTFASSKPDDEGAD